MTSITHSQALKKLAADILVQTLDEDLARLLARVMRQTRGGVDINSVLQPLLRRWNCVLQANDSVASANYRHKTAVALAILLHKYGIADADINTQAEASIDALNDVVALGDDFFRKTDSIKTAFLHTPPSPLKRAPSQPDHLSFYRAGDVVSIQLDDRYYGAYVHRCARTNESPVIEFYEASFERMPSISELLEARAKGMPSNDGSEYTAQFSVSGMKFMPDPSAQIVLIKACIDVPPDSSHLEKSPWLYTVSDIFQIQDSVLSMFSPI